MGNFHTMTPAQFAARDAFVNELPVLDEEFDEGIEDSETIRQLTPLLARPRDRWITQEDEPAISRPEP